MEYKTCLKKVYETDVLVIGGGPAGFGAAVAAAGNGAKTMLIEQGAVIKDCTAAG